MKFSSVYQATFLKISRVSCIICHLLAVGPVLLPQLVYANPTEQTNKTGENQAVLTQLFTRFAGMSGMSAKFREEKTMALLAAPLINEGTIHFARPYQFIRRVQTPTASTLLIKEHQLIVADDAGTTQFDLQANPAIERFVSSFIYIYAGNQQALQQIYTLELQQQSSQDSAWKLALVPKDPFIAKALVRIEVEGNDLSIHTMRIFEVGGDQSVTTFTDIKVNRQFTSEELEQIFQINQIQMNKAKPS